MLTMYLYCSKLIINMAVLIAGRIHIDVSGGKHSMLGGLKYR